jgi:hypothetical protein
MHCGGELLQAIKEKDILQSVGIAPVLEITGQKYPTTNRGIFQNFRGT